MHVITKPISSLMVFAFFFSFYFFLFSYTELPVLVHGGDGVDMSLVLTSLVQLLLCPETRTFQG